MSLAVANRRNFQGFGEYRNTGIGVEAKHLAGLFGRQFFEAVSRTVLLRPKLDAKEQLKAVFLECNQEDWDGEGAAAISYGAYQEAARFIGRLPLMLPMPEIIPSPNGQIGLEWYVEKSRLLVVTTGGNRSLTFAGLYGTPEAVSGIVPFADSIPEEILKRLNDLYRQ